MVARARTAPLAPEIPTTTGCVLLGESICLQGITLGIAGALPYPPDCVSQRTSTSTSVPAKTLRETKALVRMKATPMRERSFGETMRYL